MNNPLVLNSILLEINKKHSPMKITFRENKRLKFIFYTLLVVFGSIGILSIIFLNYTESTIIITSWLIFWIIAFVVMRYMFDKALLKKKKQMLSKEQKKQLEHTSLSTHIQHERLTLWYKELTKRHKLLTGNDKEDIKTLELCISSLEKEDNYRSQTSIRLIGGGLMIALVSSFCTLYIKEIATNLKAVAIFFTILIGLLFIITTMNDLIQNWIQSRYIKLKKVQRILEAIKFNLEYKDIKEG